MVTYFIFPSRLCPYVVGRKKPPSSEKQIDNIYPQYGKKYIVYPSHITVLVCACCCLYYALQTTKYISSKETSF